MLDTIGLLNLTPTKALLEIASFRNGVTLRDDIIDIRDVTALTGRQTQVTLKVRKSFDPFAPVPFSGESLFIYNRLDLGTFFGGVKVNLTLDLPTTTSHLVDILSAEYGYVFDSDDFYEEIITVSNAHGYKLRATPRSLRWVGEFSVNLLPRDDLATLAKVTNLGGLDVVENQGRTFVTHVKPFTDGLFYGSYLKTVRKGPVTDAANLTRYLDSIYGHLPAGIQGSWKSSNTPGPRNLFGAKVTYNGRVEDYGVVPYNAASTKVLVIELSPTYCTDLAGDLVIYYSSRIPTILPEFPIVYKGVPELLNWGQVHGHNFPTQITAFPTDFEFTVNNTNVAFLNSIFNQESATGEARWKCVNRQSPNNLFGAKVIFNGFNRKYPLAYNPFMGYIWVVELNDQYCTNLRGRLMIHYNLSKL
ncbi:hypothetical protein D3C71_526040 [compost metagenome]